MDITIDLDEEILDTPIDLITIDHLRDRTICCYAKTKIRETRTEWLQKQRSQDISDARKQYKKKYKFCMRKNKVLTVKRLLICKGNCHILYHHHITNQGKVVETIYNNKVIKTKG